MFKMPEKYRVRRPVAQNSPPGANYGVFFIPRVSKAGPFRLTVIASTDGEWEHVSVSLPRRCPTWEEMCFVKSLFWDAEDCVVQFHPPASSYVNFHSHCLHLWRNCSTHFPQPPAEFV